MPAPAPPATRHQSRDEIPVAVISCRRLLPVPRDSVSAGAVTPGGQRGILSVSSHLFGRSHRLRVNVAAAVGLAIFVVLTIVALTAVPDTESQVGVDPSIPSVAVLPPVGSKRLP